MFVLFFLEQSEKKVTLKNLIKYKFYKKVFRIKIVAFKKIFTDLKYDTLYVTSMKIINLIYINNARPYKENSKLLGQIG